MGLRTDAGLAVVALLAFAIAFRAADASLSVPALGLGAAGTIGFEIVAYSHVETVRRVWERPAVQLASLAGAIAIAAGGAVVAPSFVLSAGIGSLVAYFAVLAAVSIRRFRSRTG